MKQTTYRQYRTLLRWLNDRLDNPGPIEHYLMQIAAEIRRFKSMFSKTPEDISFESLKVRWTAKSFDDDDQAEDETETDQNRPTIPVPVVQDVSKTVWGQIRDLFLIRKQMREKQARAQAEARKPKNE